MSQSEASAAIGDEEVRVSTLELFFDLVFVFTITQLTDVLASDPSARGLGRVVLMLVAIWWMYGGYAWLTNALTPDRTAYRLLLLGGMAGFLVVSLAIPRAFSGDGAVFGLAYLAVVVVHGGLFTRSQAGGSASAILRIAPVNVVAASLLVAGGLLAGAAQYGSWVAAAALIAVLSIRPRSGFLIAAPHFVERHGLVVIAALGESVVAVGIGASEQPLTAGLVAVAVLGLALTACLWWAYFGEGDDERARTVLSAAPSAERPALALRAFYHWHLLILLGIVALASALERAIAHPYEALSPARSLALAGGAALYMIGEALFRRSAGAGPAHWRAAAAALALATLPLGRFPALLHLTALSTLLAACLALEHRHAALTARQRP